jgi:MFS family permease
MMSETSLLAARPQTDNQALIAIAVQFFFNGAVFASFMPRLPEIQERVGVSVGGLGLLLAIAGLAGIIGSVMVGPAIRRFGTRQVLLLGSVILGGALPLIGFANGRAVLLLGLVLMLSFDVFVDVAMNMQGSWLSARRRAPVMNRLHGLWSLGTVAGGITASRIAEAGTSLRLHLILASIFMLVVVSIVSQKLLRVDEHPPETSDLPGTTTQTKQTNFALLALFGCAGLFAVAIETTSMNWAAFRFTEDFGTTVGFGGLGYVAVTLGMTTGRFAGDWLIERLGPVRLLQLAVVLTGVGMTVAVLPAIRYANLVGFVLVGLGASTMLPRLYDLANKIGGRAGSGLGALTGGIRIAIVASPFVVGSLADSRLSVGQSIGLIVLPAVVGFFVVATAIRRFSQSAKAPQ